MTPLLGFSPDAPRTAPGIITACTSFIPYESGMEAAPGRASTGIDALAAAATNAVTWTKPDGTTRLFAATTATRIYELSSTSWTDRSAGGSAYTATNFVTFAPFGTAIVAALGTATDLQVSTTGAFSAISGSPNAKIVFPVITSGGGFVIAANTDTAVDQWACSGVNDHTTWTASVATQANNGRLLGNDAGAITAGIEFGDRAVLFKQRTMFLGNYVGTPSTFQWAEIPGGAGCVGPYAVATIDIGLFFVGPDQLWVYDGARPVPVGEKVRQWFFNNLSATYRDRVRVVFERMKNRVRIFYPNTSSTGNPNACLVFHLITKEFGQDDQTVETAFSYIQPAVVINSLSATINSYTNLINGEEWNPTSRSIAVIGTDHKIYTLTGAPGASNFTSEDFGDEFNESFMDEIRLRYAQVPSTAQAIGYTLDEAADDADTQLTEASSDVPADAKNKFDLRQCGRFHRVKFDFTGSVRVIGKQPRLQPAGGR